MWIRLMNMSIYKKLMLFMVCSTCIVLVVITVGFVLLSNASTTEQLDISNLNILSQCNTVFKNLQASMISMVDYFGILPESAELIDSFNKGEQPVLFSLFLCATVVQPGLADLSFYNIDGQLISGFAADNSLDPLDQNVPGRPLQNMITSGQLYAWEYLRAGDIQYFRRTVSDRFSLWHILSDVNTMKPIGAVCFSVTAKHLRSLLLSNLQGILLLLDQQGNDLINNTLLSQDDLLNIQKVMPSTLTKGVLDVKLHNQFYRAAFLQMDRLPFTLIYLSTKPSSPNINRTLPVFLLLTLTLLSLAFTLFIVVNRMITKPIRKLSNSMMQFTNGDLTIKTVPRYRDEIGDMCRIFDQMVDHIRTLIETTYLLKIKEKEAELQSLQTQINPHFLNNLISMIQWKALRNKDQEIADIAYSMGQVFRLSLNHGEGMMMLEQEKNLIDYYLILQKKRYPRKLEYRLNFESDTLSVVIPKLIIQPLVENAIVHGTEGSTKTVLIIVSAHRAEGNRLVITVEDNGAGIPQDILSLLPDHLVPNGNSSGNRFAMRNIAERLQLTYGEQYRFLIDSLPNQGTTITIDIPIENKKEEGSIDSTTDCGR
jgi:two-component system, sensor histidine kinase YesM